MNYQQLYDKLNRKDKPYKQYWRSYLTMITHPRKSLMLINFAHHVIINEGIETN